MEFKENNVYNVDCYEAIKEIPDKSIDCIYTDIPYLYIAGSGGKGDVAQRIRRKHEILEGKGLADGVDYGILDEFVRVMKKINIYIWCSKLQILDILNYFDKIDDCFFEILVWVKTNPTPQTNNVWLSDVEYCLYFREKGVKLNDGYSVKSKWYSSGLNMNDKRHYNHPTIKPLECVENHLLHTTQEGDVVLGPFMGSGTTCVACKVTKRKYIGFEIDPDYFEEAKHRINNSESLWG